MSELLIVVPAYNEETAIPSVLQSIRGCRPDADVLVVNDGSRDGTQAEAERAGVMVIRHTCNLGYGVALQTGFRFAMKSGYEYVVIMDADGQHDPSFIPGLFDKMRLDDADVVIGSRFLSGNYRMGFARRIGACIFAGVARLYTGYRFTDPTSGFQLLNRRAFSCLAMEESFPPDYPDVNIIMLLHKKKFRVVESPVAMFDSINGNTMHSGLTPVVYVLRMVLAIIMVLLRKEE